MAGGGAGIDVLTDFKRHLKRKYMNTSLIKHILDSGLETGSSMLHEFHSTNIRDTEQMVTQCELRYM